MFIYIYTMDKLILVKSSGYDYDYITTYPLPLLYGDISTSMRHVKTLKSGPVYIQLQVGHKVFNIWKVEKKQLRNNEILRSMSEDRYIDLGIAIKEIGMRLNFNGIRMPNSIKYFDIEDAINKIPELERFKDLILSQPFH